MMGTFNGFSLGIGLAGLTGFRAFFPLVIASLIARNANFQLYRAPFHLLASTWILIILLFFLVVEVFSAKAPSNTTIQDFTEIVAKILAGALLFAAIFSGTSIFWGLVIGGIIAAIGIMVKALLRSFLISSIDGANLFLITAIEDMIAFIGTVLVILIPVVSILIIVYIIYLAFKRFKQQNRPVNSRKTRFLR